MFFIWRKTTEAAAERDDNIMSHPSRFSTYTFPGWKQASMNGVERKLVAKWFSGFLYEEYSSITLLANINK